MIKEGDALKELKLELGQQVAFPHTPPSTVTQIQRYALTSWGSAKDGNRQSKWTCYTLAPKDDSQETWWIVNIPNVGPFKLKRDAEGINETSLSSDFNQEMSGIAAVMDMAATGGRSKVTHAAVFTFGDPRKKQIRIREIFHTGTHPVDFVGEPLRDGGAIDSVMPSRELY